MKVFLAVVSSVTDYRKDQTVDIDHSSVHLTSQAAAQAVMTAIINRDLRYASCFELDYNAILGPEEDLTDYQHERLKDYWKKEEIEEWVYDDLPLDDTDAEVFIQRESSILKDQASKVKDFLLRDEKEIPFKSSISQAFYWREGTFMSQSYGISPRRRLSTARTMEVLPRMVLTRSQLAHRNRTRTKEKAQRSEQKLNKDSSNSPESTSRSTGYYMATKSHDNSDLALSQQAVACYRSIQGN